MQHLMLGASGAHNQLSTGYLLVYARGRPPFIPVSKTLGRTIATNFQHIVIDGSPSYLKRSAPHSATQRTAVASQARVQTTPPRTVPHDMAGLSNASHIKEVVMLRPAILTAVMRSPGGRSCEVDLCAAAQGNL